MTYLCMAESEPDSYHVCADNFEQAARRYVERIYQDRMHDLAGQRITVVALDGKYQPQGPLNHFYATTTMVLEVTGVRRAS